MMDKVLEKANTYKWAQLESIQQEYTIFVESESNDRKDAVVEGVDLSSAESLFSNIDNLIMKKFQRDINAYIYYQRSQPIFHQFIVFLYQIAIFLY